MLSKTWPRRAAITIALAGSALATILLGPAGVLAKFGWS